MAQHGGVILGWVAAMLSLSSFMMKSMLPLRLLAMISNVSFIAFGYVDGLVPVMALHSVLLPVNASRLWQIRKLSKAVASASHEFPISQWLLPHMTRQAFTKGEVLFNKGDVADRLFYLAQGQLRLGEAGQILEARQLIGEIGLFAPDKKRTHTIICETDGVLYWMTDEMIFRIYYQQPRMGFYLMRLITERLLRDLQQQRTAAVAHAG